MIYHLIHFQIGVGERGDPENDALSIKPIGMYRSVEDALHIVERLRTVVGFRKWPHGFRIYPVTVDRIDWPDGFTEAEADRLHWNWPEQEIEPA